MGKMTVYLDLIVKFLFVVALLVVSHRLEEMITLTQGAVSIHKKVTEDNLGLNKEQLKLLKEIRANQ